MERKPTGSTDYIFNEAGDNHRNWRNTWCREYDKCLDIAAKKDWLYFTCAICPLKDRDSKPRVLAELPVAEERLLQAIAEPSICKVEGCGMRSYGRSYCREHQAQFSKTAKPCTEPGCKKFAYAQGLCRNCYARKWNNGTLKRVQKHVVR